MCWEQKENVLRMIIWLFLTFCSMRFHWASNLQRTASTFWRQTQGRFWRKKKQVKQSITPFSHVCRWQVTPYAPICWTRCPQLNGSSERRTQVLCPHPLQPASPLHLWCACAPHTPQLPVQQCAPGLPPPPPVHEQEDRECTVKITTLRRPVSVSCYPLMQVNIQVYGASSV